MRQAFIFIFISVLIPSGIYGQIFGNAQEITTSANQLRYVAVENVDGGMKDILFASANESKIAWFKGDALGFKEQDLVSLSDSGVSSAVYIDLDLDGLEDVVWSSLYSNIIGWHRNEGNGEFASSESLIFVQGPSTIAVSDVNGDGWDDIVCVAGSSDSIHVYLSLGLLQFAQPIIVDCGGIWASTYSLQLVDLDGDQDSEILLNIYTQTFNYEVLVWDFTNAEIQGPYSATNGIPTVGGTKVVCSDRDNDGDLDLLIPSYTEDKVRYVENLGGFEFDTDSIYLSGFPGIQYFEELDFDQDGIQDILWFSNGDTDSDIKIRYGTVSSGYGPTESLITLNYPPAFAPIVEDVNGDGLSDIVFAGYYHTISQLIYLENQGNRQFEINRPNDYFRYAENLSLADFNGDGYLDVLLSGELDEVTLYFYLPVQEKFSLPSVVGYISEIKKQIPFDVDQDGDKDILISTLLDDPLMWFENNGNGEFMPVQTLIEDNGIYQDPFVLKAVDLDVDGHMDVVISFYDVGVFALYGQENGGFGELINVCSCLYAWDVGFVNNDSDPEMEIIVLESESSPFGLGPAQLRIYNYLDANTYDLQVEILDGTLEEIESNVLLLSDLDTDGDLDIVLSSAEVSYVIERESMMQYTLNSNVVDAYGLQQAFDYDNDGDLDFLGSYQLSSSPLPFGTRMNIVQNTGVLDSLTLVEVNLIQFGIGTRIHQEAGDIDGDGHFEIVQAIPGANRVQWLSNLARYGCIDSQACNFDSSALTSNNTCCFTDCGCTDPIAENYDANATCENGTCQYILGCTTLGAENYNPSATMNDGSCAFLIQGVVYHDENENGIRDALEYGLPFQEVLALPDNIVMITNDEGEFYGNSFGSLFYTYELLENEIFPINTTPQSLSFDATNNNWNQPIQFGISDQIPVFSISIELYPSSGEYPCDVFTNHNICYRNLGNYPINGYIEIDYDPLFQTYQAVTPIDSVNGNKLYLSFENLLPGQMFFDDIKLKTPTVDHIGEILTSTARIYGYYEGQEVAYGDKTLTMEVTCAYDPNDKQVIPAGYTEAHYIADDQQLEYLIRFQNTGNAPAADVVIRDTLDQNLKLSSFQLVANSHSVLTSLNPNTREVVFNFQNIMLPDSVNNEPESHGLVSFKIRPKNGIAPLTEIHNTAGIYFDNNPPIVTNTTWSTLYDCSLFNVSFNEDGAILTASEGDSYQWFFEGEEIAGATAQEYTATENGNYAVQVSSDFPCTDLTPSVYILVSGLQELNGNTITLFPNPFTETAILDLGSLHGSVQMEIFDITGKLVRSEQLTTNNKQLTLERGNLTIGHYLLRLNHDEGSYELPFVVK